MAFFCTQNCSLDLNPVNLVVWIFFSSLTVNPTLLIDGFGELRKILNSRKGSILQYKIHVFPDKDI